jgi:hypothetical protein
MTVTLAIPCRTDEPALGRTLDEAWTRAVEAGVTVTTLVCLNGASPGDCAAARAIAVAAERSGRALRTLDVDAAPRGETGPAFGDVVVLATAKSGKAVAWNLLRERIATELVVFLDADVALGPGAIARLLAVLAREPAAIVASPKTACAPRDTAFERVMAAPYGVDFPNLSGQLYAARTAGLPARMPEDLIEPERWLELAVGREHVVRDPAARVIVRLPGTLRDFYRQRVRIEMGKVQIERAYPDLLPRGNPQPRLRAALRALPLGELVRLGVYLVLRESAHLVARRRYGRLSTQAAWVQATSTKEWPA